MVKGYMGKDKVSVISEPALIASPLAGKHIIIVLGCFILGGAERQAILLAKWLVKKHAAKVQIWGLFDPGEAIELCEAWGIPWRIVPPQFGRHRLTRWPKAVLNFAKLLRKERPDVLLPYCAPPANAPILETGHPKLLVMKYQIYRKLQILLRKS